MKALLIILIYLVIVYLAATRLGKFLKGVDEDAKKHFKTK